MTGNIPVAGGPGSYDQPVFLFVLYYTLDGIAILFKVFFTKDSVIYQMIIGSLLYLMMPRSFFAKVLNDMEPAYARKHLISEGFWGIIISGEKPP